MGTAEAKGMRNSGARAWTLAALMDCAGIQPAGGPSCISSIPISLLTDNSRKVSPGSCFVAVRGSGVDGHDFMEAAVRAGAEVIVGEREHPAVRGTPFIRVADSREALAKLSAAWYGLRDLSYGGSGNGELSRRRTYEVHGPVQAPADVKLFGVTGTNGKTTVAWMIRAILQAAERKAALFGTVEYDVVSRKYPAPLTTPGAIELCAHLAEARSAGAEFAVLEVSSHALDQRRTDGLNFAAAIFTNLTGDHLDYHGSMEAYFAAKRRLFEGLADSAAGIINLEDPMAGKLLAACRGETFTFGVDLQQADAVAEVAGMDRAGTRLSLRFSERLLQRNRRVRREPATLAPASGQREESGSSPPRPGIALELGLVGKHNISNALAAAAAALSAGISPAAIRRGLESLRGVPGRLEDVAPGDCPFSVLVDYAHTDDALRNVLTAVRPVTPGRIICVFGCGGNRDRSKRPRMAEVAERYADRIIVTSDNPRKEDPLEIIADILGGFSAKLRESVGVEPDRRAAIAAAIASAEPGDAVLIAGKGHEDYQLVGDRVLSFDDAHVARECLSAAMVS